MTRALVGRTVADVERDLILETLKHCLGNRTHAANILGISIRTLRNKLNEYADDGVPIPPSISGSTQIDTLMRKSGKPDLHAAARYAGRRRAIASAISSFPRKQNPSREASALRGLHLSLLDNRGGGAPTGARVQRHPSAGRKSEQSGRGAVL